MTTFSDDERDRIRETLLARARHDPRVVAAAVVGSFATGQADRWSDIDIALAIDPAARLDDVLHYWTDWLVESEAAVHLLDLPAGAAIYRVLLLRQELQIDLSVWPADEFHSGPGFQLVFGTALAPKPPSAPPTGDLFGWAVVYAIHARACIERGRLWQADYDINALRERALAIACIKRGLKASYGRGFDDLPPELKTAFASTRASHIAAAELCAATARSIRLLVSEANELDERVPALQPTLISVARFLEERSAGKRAVGTS